MDKPIKVIHKFKNINRRTQYAIYIFLGELVSDELINILNTIQKRDFYDCLLLLSSNKYKLLVEAYGEYWYKYFFNKYHIKNIVKNINKNPGKRRELEKRYGKEWYNKHFADFKMKKTEYSFASSFYDYLIARNKIKSKVKKVGMNFTTYKQTGGAEDIDEDEDIMKTQEDVDDDVEEDFNLDELTKLYSVANVEKDKNIEETAKLISQATNDKNFKKELEQTESVADDKLDELPYDTNLEDVYYKNYIYDHYIFMDDNIKKIKQKITVSVPISDKFGDGVKILPDYQYLWIEYNLETGGNTAIDRVMLGQKWIRRNELLQIDVKPNDNLSVYENLRNNLSYLKGAGSAKLKRQDDESLILRDYEDFMNFNEIYMIDIFNELGVNYNTESDKLRNLYEVYVNIYFPTIPYKKFENIIELLNGNNEKEIDNIINIFKTINNELRMEREIYNLVEETKLIDNKYNKNFKNPYILHTIIHVDLFNDKNKTGTLSPYKFNLYRIFDSFVVDDKYPFIQYQTPDSSMTYKFYNKTEKINETEILSKWFESTPYGVSFKIKTDDNFFTSVSLNETGKIEYKITWKENDNAVVDDIKKSYKYVYDLIGKINNENKKIKIIIPDERKFKYAFINSIMKFEIPGKYKINHNDLSDFSRFFYTYVSMVIEPKKRTSGNVDNTFSKFGTYLRYKRISNYENKTKMHMRMLYYLRNFEISDKEIIDEIAKQFNLTLEDTAAELDEVRNKYGTILGKAKKKLQKVTKLTGGKPPGVEVDIQGRTPETYKVRITGARSKEQLNEIVDFTKVLLYLYVETYLLKTSKYQKVKTTLLQLNKIAKRRNLVNNFVDYEKKNIEIKNITKLDKKRLGFRPEEGQNQWSRSCQNSGDKVRKRPIVVSEADINKLIRKGYKKNKENGFYEKNVIVKEKGVKKTVTLKAVSLPNDDGSLNYFACDPSENNEYIYVGFLSKSNNPNDLCMPCCYKKNQANSNNKKKKAYYEKCIGELKSDSKIEQIATDKIGDKIYILQETNKFIEGKFISLSKYLNYFFNCIWGNDKKIVKRYMIESNSGYFLKFTVKDQYYHFLAAIANIYNINIEDIKNKVIDVIKNDKNDTIFTYLNNGDIKTMFETREKYIDHIKNNNYLEYDIMGEILQLPNIISDTGIKYYILEKKVRVIKKKLEKDTFEENYYIKCLNNENIIDNKKTDNIILLRDGKYYFPIYWVQKGKKDKKFTLVKKYNYYNFKNVIDELENYYNKSCFSNKIHNLSNLNDLNAKIIYNKYNINVKKQIIDIRNKVRFLYINIDSLNILIPTLSSGSIINVNIDTYDNLNKYISNLDTTIKNLKTISKILKDLNYQPKTLFYESKKNDTYNITSILLYNKLILPVKKIQLSSTQIKKYGLSYEFQSLEEKIDTEINNNNIFSDERKQRVNQVLYRNEGYNLFRLEMSYYLDKNYDLRDKIINIVRSNSITKKYKRRELIGIISDIINKKIKKNGKIETFVELVDKLPDLSDYNISNIRDYCHIYKNDKCNNKHCIFSRTANNCQFRLIKDYTSEYIQKIVEEMVDDNIKFKELIQENDEYFVSDIVDYTIYSNRPDQQIIKASSVNVKKLMKQLFGENNMPKLGKRRIKSKQYIDDEYPELVVVGDKFIQQVLNNSDSIIRAYVNSYYWINNNLYDKNSRNLGYFSDLQEQITNVFKANIIDFILNNSFNKELMKDLKQYNDNDNFFLTSVNKFRNNENNTDGIVELIVLSYLFDYSIIVYDNFNNVKYIFSKGIVKVNEKTIKKYTNDKKNTIYLQFNLEEGNNVPNKIFSIYYK
jgi:hypothetical protein